MEAGFMERYLIQIEDVLETSKAVPFSGKVAVDKELIYDIVDEIRMNLPNELKESKKLIETKDKFLREAEKRSETAIENAQLEADAIIQDAERKAERLVSEHEIYRIAQEEAEIMMEEAKRDAKNVRLNALDYADEILVKAEHAMRVTLENIEKQHNQAQDYYYKVLDTLYENRQELRNTK